HAPPLPRRLGMDTPIPHGDGQRYALAVEHAWTAMWLCGRRQAATDAACVAVRNTASAALVCNGIARCKIPMHVRLHAHKTKRRGRDDDA
ncbi:hypothetical protein P2C91_20445, partial [Xanthomonas perforans]